MPQVEEYEAKPERLYTPRPVTEEASVQRVYQRADCNQYRAEVEKYDWPVEIAMAVMSAESGCNPNAINWSDSHAHCQGSFGLFQISCQEADLLNPTENIRIAYEQKYSTPRGWKHWSTCLSINGKPPVVDCGIY